MSETKKCAQCGQEKPIEDFSKSYKNLCKACVAENARVARQTMAYAKSSESRMPSFYCGRGIEVPIPEYAVFINPMRFQASVAAMQGLLANPTWMSNLAKGFKAEYPDPKDAEQALIREVVTSSVQMSDALINELNKKTDEVEADK